MSGSQQIRNSNHLTFIDVYMTNGFNATRAYLTAYPESSYDAARTSGAELVARPDIKNEIEARKAQLAEQYDIKKEDIINHLKKLIEDCSQDGDRHHLIKALDMLNKMCGTYNHVKKVDHTIGVENIQTIKLIEVRKDNPPVQDTPFTEVPPSNQDNE